jgi:hypothetical protein
LRHRKEGKLIPSPESVVPLHPSDFPIATRDGADEERGIFDEKETNLESAATFL